MYLKDVTINYQENPMGIDEFPGFSWKLCSDHPNTLQKSYQIIIKEHGKHQVWDSGVVVSDQSILVEYKGGALKPFTAYHVTIRVTDNHGETDTAQATFETGVMKQNNWDAAWITHAYPQDENACPIFGYTLRRQEKKLVSARAYITSLGVYELKINGVKIGQAFLTPGWTSYKKRLQYQTYDITDDFSQNTNRINITLGNGWYKGYLNGEGENCFYGDRVAVLAMFRLTYADGTVEVIGTGEDWEVSTGVIRSSELYMGEMQDFTIEKQAVYKAVRFDATEKISSIVAQESEFVKITQRIPAVRKILTLKGEIVIDFGQNMAGIVEVRLPKLSGKSLVIAHGESLDKNGNFYNTNLRTAKSTDEYIYADEQVGHKVLPHFTYHGFRYIRVGGVDEDVDISCFTACVLHTGMKRTGTFHCSNPLVGQLQRNIEWGQRSNFVDIPTDCPQRDERLGWTGDAQIFCHTAVYNFEAVRFYKKWLRDVAAETDDAHGVPHIVPNIVGPSTGTAVWSDCATIIPWTLYRIYGDTGILREQYINMKQWVDYVRRSCGDHILWMNGFQRGDWLSLDSDESLHLMCGGTDKNLVANVYYAHSTRIVRDSAKILGKQRDYEVYAESYNNIVNELNREYVTPNGRLVSETQTACALLLYFDLIKEEYRERVVKILEDNLMAHRGHLTTGFVGTAFLCHALTENGKHALAEDVLLAVDYPGWLYAVKMGATTLWERWNSILPDGDFDESGMNSLNHYAFGAIGDWLYRKVLGINLLLPGYKKILIKPTLTKSMERVSGTFESVYGTISCDVQCEKGKIVVDVIVPANTTAILELPEKENEIEVGSGSYHYEYKTDTYLKAFKITMNSTMGECITTKYGMEIFEKYMPGMSKNPAIDYLKNKTLNDLAAMAPDQKVLLEAIVREIQEKEQSE